MKISAQKLENSQAELNIEVEAADMEKSLGEAYRRLVKRTMVPGFRPGKAPREVLERYIGKEALRREALNHLLPQAYDQAVKETGLEVIDQPQFEIQQTETTVFKATVSLRPTVELGDYHALQVSSEVVEITEAEVEKAVAELRQQQALWEPVERPVQMDDLVTLNVQGLVEDKAILNQKGLQYEVRAGASFPVPGFAEHLVGLPKGEEREFQLSLPGDYPGGLGGKTALFRAEVTEIKGRKLPPVDDEFAKGLNFPDLAALRDKVTASLKARAEAEARRRLELKALDALVSISRLDFPSILVEREMKHMAREQEGHWGKQNLSETGPQEELRPVATERVKRSLVLSKLTEMEKIEVSPQEIEEEVERLARGVGAKETELRRFLGTPAAQQSLRDGLLTQKALERLVAISTGQERPTAVASESVPPADVAEQTAEG